MNISKFAKSSAKVEDYKKEWKKEYFASLAFKSTLAVFSVVTGFYSLYLTFFTLIPIAALSAGLSGLVLVLIEILSAGLLGKFFKFLLRGRVFWLNSALLLPLVLATMVASFYFSTNGLAAFVSGQVDESGEINSTYNAEKTALDTQFKQDLKQIDDQIRYIQAHPAWRGKLIPSQLAEIKSLNAERVEVRKTYKEETRALKEEKNGQLDANTANQTSNADKYYTFAAIITILQVFLSFVIAHMSRVIYSKDCSKQYLNENTQAINQGVFKNIQSNTISQANSFADSLKEQYDLNTILTDFDELTAKQLAAVTADAGKAVETNVSDTPAVTAVDTSADTANAVTADEKTAFCEHCGEPFDKTVWNKRFCSEACKELAWTEKTGKPVVFRKR